MLLVTILTVINSQCLVLKNINFLQGDVWAESTMLGFRWHYFALMEGNVFDITEWMACHVRIQ